MDGETARRPSVGPHNAPPPPPPVPVPAADSGPLEGGLVFSDDRAKLAVPKKGRIYESVMELLKGCDIKFSRKARLDIATATNLPVDLVFLPAADVAMYVAAGDVDLGITGRDIVQETGLPVDTVIEDLGIGACKLCLQIPARSDIQDPHELIGRRVVTSFPNITRSYFTSLAATTTTTSTPLPPQTQVMVVHGSVEVACAMGLADCIVDLVETGETMRAAGLKVLATIMETQLMLIANPHTKHRPLIEYVKKRMVGYLTATKYCYLVYNIAKDKAAEAERITPGKRSPTVSTLEDSQFVSISVLVKRSEVQATLDALEAIGAMDMLVFDLRNTRGF